MRYRALGSTGVTVSEIGLGGGGIGAVYGQTTEEESVRTVHSALELGFNFFDVAPRYGEGTAETVLGKGLEGHRDEAVIMTKIAMTEEAFEDVRAFVRTTVAASLERLRTDHVDFLVLHNPLSSVRGRPVMLPGDIMMITLEEAFAVMDEIQQLRQEGLTRYVGFTAWRCIESAMVAMLDSGLVDAIQVHYNLLDHTARTAPVPGQDVTSVEALERDPDTDMVAWSYRPIDQHLAIALAAERSIGVVSIRPLAGGFLTTGLDRPPQPGDMSDVLSRRAEALGFLTTDGKRTLPQAALAFCLADPAVSTVIPSAKNVAELEELARASEIGPLDPETIEQLTELARTDFGVQL